MMDFAVSVHERDARTTDELKGAVTVAQAELRAVAERMSAAVAMPPWSDTSLAVDALAAILLRGDAVTAEELEHERAAIYLRVTEEQVRELRRQELLAGVVVPPAALHRRRVG